jgi:hypothetical protein
MIVSDIIMNAHCAARTLATALVLGAGIAAANAEGIFVRRDTVVPIRFESDLTIKGSRTGQRFYATVDQRGDLPFGSRLEGRILGVHEATDRQPAYLDLEFTRLIQGDESRDLRATPMAFDDRHIDKMRDGRFVAKRSVRRRSDFALGGAAAGFIIGSIFKKQVEGLVAGLVAGIILAETDRVGDDNVVIRRGQRMGALVTKDFRWNDYQGESGWNVRDEDPNNDWTRPDDRQPGWQSGPSRPVDDYELRAGSRRVEFGRSERPYYIGDTLMVPVEALGDAFRISIKKNWDDSYEVRGERAIMRLQRDSREFRTRERFGTLPVAAVERYGVIYVPVDVLATVSREKVTVNGNRIRPLA